MSDWSDQLRSVAVEWGRPARRTVVAVAFTLVGCSSQIVPVATPTVNTRPVRIYATSSTLSLTSELTSAYTRNDDATTVEVLTQSYAALSDMAMNSDAIYFIANHLPSDSVLWAAPIAQDGIAILVHPSNPVNNLTLPQLRNIYRGQLTSWADVGGFDMPIQPITRESRAGTRLEFERQVTSQASLTSSALIAPSSSAMLDLVSCNPGALGYVSMGFLKLDGVKLLAVDGIIPTQVTIQANVYPLRSTIFIIGPTEPDGVYRNFIAWMQSPDGQAVVGQRFVPLIMP